MLLSTRHMTIVCRSPHSWSIALVFSVVTTFIVVLLNNHENFGSITSPKVSARYAVEESSSSFHNVLVAPINDQRQKVLDFIRGRKLSNPNYKVIDVGGSAAGWSASVIDALIDINPPENDDKFLYFQVNLGSPDSWESVERYVEKNGKFDFCICTHTLEDLAHPQQVVSQISKIASSGAISTPSKYSELTRFEVAEPGLPTLHLGWIHHRWIFTFQHGKWMALPKLNFLDHDPFFEGLTNSELSAQYGELHFFWENDVHLTLLNDDYMGPSATAVVKMFKEALSDDDFHEAPLPPSLQTTQAGSAPLLSCELEASKLSVFGRLKYMRDTLRFSPVNILDVGANEGLWTAAVMKIFPGATFRLFEANELHSSKLQTFGHNFTIGILGDEVKKVKWYIAPGAHTGSSMFRERTKFYSDENPDLQVVERKMSTLDNELNEEPYALMKLDVQGSELLVLKGAKSVLKSVEALTLELSIVQYNSGSPLALEMFQHLANMGFQLFDICELHWKDHSSGALFQIQFDIVALRKSSDLVSKLPQTLNCPTTKIALSIFDLCLSIGFAPESISCASETCVHWTEDSVHSMFPGTRFIPTGGELLALSVFPNQDPNSMDFLGEYGREYQVLQVGNMLSNDSLQIQVDFVLVKKISAIFNLLTEGWLER